MFYVYVLYSKEFNRTYTGMTIDIEKRLKEHNLRQNTSTKAYVPWEIIYKEELETRQQARNR